MIRFLKSFWRRFAGWATPSRFSIDPQAYEPLSRFIFSSEHFAETKALVKPKAFLPDQRGETSVFRVLELSESEIWRIGSAIRTEPARARGDVLASVAQKNGLRVEPAPEEHVRHAVIVGWPAEKHEKLAVATQLSKEATLRLPPRPPQ